MEDLNELLNKLLEINEYYKLTKQSKEIIPLDPEFYQTYKEYIEKCKSKVKNMDIMEPETRRAISKIIHAENYLKLILAHRSIKMFELILIKNLDEPPPELLDEEIKIWNDLLKIRERINNIIVPRERKYKVEFLEDVDEFTGFDGQSYGPFKKGDIIELPTSIVKMLEKAQLVRRL
jgi:hypothetical protein